MQMTHDEPKGGYGGGSSTLEDGTVDERITGRIANVKTDTGKTYYIGFESYYLNKYMPYLEGVVWLAVFDEDTYDEYKYYNGYPDYGMIEIRIGVL